MARRLPSVPPILSGYTYVRPLGSGGFADVFLFEQNMPRRPVAIKVLLRDVVDNDVLRMFNAEADVMARLSAHPAILTVFTASISADGRPYLVMEYCPGSPGQTYRREAGAVADVLALAVKIACALETAHRSGVLHRDIKPSNILVTTLGAPVLADFGIAASLTSLDTEHLIAMSVPWSAPEVVAEHTTGTVATEVWSFGATIYSLLASRAPFEVTDAPRPTAAQLKSRIGRAKYTPIGGVVPAALEEFLARTMSRDPGRRQQSLLQCARELQLLQQGLGLPPTPLEVAADEWAAAATPVDFNNTVVPGPPISVVAVESKRRKRESAPAVSQTNEGTRFNGAAAPRRSGGSGLKLALLLAGAVIAGVAATLLVLSLAGLVG
ncbi:serine/threonine protein kinase [Cryobacterium algoricola]|uniref:non-specific serine/threonine protein kinase n=1 Tax=Cryobacterium algoricola TaxID=1259183 RepID=A0ABY2I9W1_9MICO|nr:serine/threonine protein kinase [Cryobacterium algoricola]